MTALEVTSLQVMALEVDNLIKFCRLLTFCCGKPSVPRTHLPGDLNLMTSHE